jgi:signal transduction histidine kinase
MLEKTQRDFFSQIGERLEQPLLVIQEQLNCIIDVENSTDMEGRKRLSLALTQAKRVQEIIHTLIEISQLEYGEITLDLRTVRLKQIMDSTAAQFINEATRKGLCFKTICRPDNLSVLADEKQLKLALENLISNAIYFTNEGFVTVICEESGSMVLIRVEDSGRGIPQNQIDRIFERFYRVEPADAGNGAGLGLVLAKEIIRAHGQILEVESRLGVGSYFSFCLPKAPFPS